MAPGTWLHGDHVKLRCVTLQDCTPRYERWLADPAVNRYLETRWAPQPLDAIRAFVAGMVASPDNYLLAICQADNEEHIGNIKVGPIHPRHSNADVSYFIGERSSWGKGAGTEAVRLATRFAFDVLGIHRTQAGLYDGNVGSQRVLERAGYKYEGRFEKQLRAGVDPAGQTWEDHLFYGALRATWS